ncbi:hypothetical protein CCP4SC76_3300001 [Gammaproteobacteria bacterium]
MSEDEASQYEATFQHVLEHIKPERDKDQRETHRTCWWRHPETKPRMSSALFGLHRYMVTPRVSKHWLFQWLDAQVLSGQTLVVLARHDDTTFGILQSRFHELWSRHLRRTHKDRYRYTLTTFESFPFPKGCNPDDTRPLDEDECDEFVAIPISKFDTKSLQWVPDKARYYMPPLREPDSPVVRHWMNIAKTASHLNELRDNWLNPPDWVEQVPAVIPEYPDRLITRSSHEAELKMRTLTSLYDQRPDWLDNAHKTLDKTVAAAYGWTDYTEAMSDDEIIKRLLLMNLKGSEKQPNDAVE